MNEVAEKGAAAFPSRDRRERFTDAVFEPPNRHA
jgi:hypothetical protein